MNSKKLIPEIQNYIDLVRSGTIEVCKEQLQLMDFIEKCFEKENLFVDEAILKKYLSLQKYFPFKLFDWEVFLFTLHNCKRQKFSVFISKNFFDKLNPVVSSNQLFYWISF